MYIKYIRYYKPHLPIPLGGLFAIPFSETLFYYLKDTKSLKWTNTIKNCQGIFAHCTGWKLSKTKYYRPIINIINQVIVILIIMGY